MNEKTSRVTFVIPMAKQDVVAKLYRFAKVEEVAYDGENTVVTAICDGKAKGMFREYAAKPE